MPALLPLAGTAAGQFDADADVGLHVQLLGFACDNLQLVHLLHHNEDMLAHLLCQECQFDVALVLVAVADNDRVALTLHGDDRMQLGLRTGFQSEVELASV